MAIRRQTPHQYFSKCSEDLSMILSSSSHVIKNRLHGFHWYCFDFMGENVHSKFRPLFLSSFNSLNNIGVNFYTGVKNIVKMKFDDKKLS